MATTLPERADASPVQPPRGLSLQTFAAFQSRRFTWLWINALSFVLSQSIQQFALVWLALDRGSGGGVLGAVAFSLGLPVLVFALPAGVLADQFDRRLLLFASQLGSLAVASTAAVLVWTDAINTPVMIMLALLLGTSTALGQPVRVSIVPSIVEPARLLNAITLMSLGQNMSQIVGPALVGAVIVFAGVGGAFTLQASLLLCGLAALTQLRIPRPQGATRERSGRSIGEGFAFVIRTPAILSLMVLLLTVTLVMGGAFVTLLPKIAREELEVGALGTTLLLTAMGIGTLLCSLALASVPSIRRAGLLFMSTVALGGLLHAVIGLSTAYALTFAMMILIGLHAGVFTNLNMTLVQAHTPQHLMGRVMAIYTLSLAGGMPLGGLLAGVMSEVTGAPQWYSIAGVMMFVAGTAAIITQRSLREMGSEPRAAATR